MCHRSSHVSQVFTCVPGLHMCSQVFTCVPRSSHVSQVFTCVHRSSHVFTGLHMCSQVFTCVPGLHMCHRSSHVSQVFTCVHRSSHVFTGLHMCSQVFTCVPGLHMCSQVFTCVHRSSHVFTGLHMCSQVFTCISRSSHVITFAYLFTCSVFPDILLSLWSKRVQSLVFFVHSYQVNTVVWSRDGRELLSGSDDRQLIISDPFTKKVAISFSVCLLTCSQ